MKKDTPHGHTLNSSEIGTIRVIKSILEINNTSPGFFRTSAVKSIV